jgi:hypothetical protein
MTVPPADATQTIRRAAEVMRKTLAELRDEMATGDYWACDHPDATPDEIWTSGVVDGLGGEAGSYAGSWTPTVALLVAGLLDAIAADIDAVMADHGGAWFGTVPAEWSAAHDLATAYLKETAR